MVYIQGKNRGQKARTEYSPLNSLCQITRNLYHILFLCSLPVESLVLF